MNNIAEGFERCSNKEFRNFLYIAKGSCGEFRSMLYLAKDLKYIKNDDFEKLVEWYESDPGRYSEEDRAYIDEAVKKATDQRKRLGKFTTVVNPDNPTLVSVENESVNPNGNGTSNESENTSVKSTGPKLPILDKREQGYVYRRIVKQIKRLLKENKKERADNLALDYQDFFENPGTNEDFITQVNRIYRELKKASPLPMM
jgi:hypothetical protein